MRHQGSGTARRQSRGAHEFFRKFAHPERVLKAIQNIARSTIGSGTSAALSDNYRPSAYRQ